MLKFQVDWSTRGDILAFLVPSLIVTLPESPKNVVATTVVRYLCIPKKTRDGPGAERNENMHSRSGMIFKFGFPFLAHFSSKLNPSFNQSKMGMRLSVEFQSPSRDANSIFGPVPLVPGRKLNLGYFPIFRLTRIPYSAVLQILSDAIQLYEHWKLVCIFAYFVWVIDTDNRSRVQWQWLIHGEQLVNKYSQA